MINTQRLKRLVAWILTNAYGRHNTTWYEQEVKLLCVYVTMLLNRPFHELVVLYNYYDSRKEDSLQKRTLGYVMQSVLDLADKNSELYEWEFDYSDEFNRAFEAKWFERRPVFFAENKVSNELIAYGT